MTSKGKKVLFTVASATALAAFFFSNSTVEQSVKRKISSVEVISEIASKDIKVEEAASVSKQVETKKNKVSLEAVPAPAPYFLNSDNFKTYDKILYKVVRSPEEKSSFNLSLLDHRSLEDASSYLKNPSAKPGKEEKIYHLKASGFLIKAISAHPNEFEVTKAIKEVLDVNLSAAKANMTEASYTMLKENKAELMYHALAVSEDIKSSYSAASEDSESQKLLQNVQNLHTSNISISQKMIAER